MFLVGRKWVCSFFCGFSCTGIGDDGVAALSSGCKKLKKLNLSYCNNITDRGIKILGYLEELSDLELRGLGKITSVGLTAFAAKCGTLADLDLKHCWNIDDMGFCALAYYSRNLRQVLNSVNRNMFLLKFFKMLNFWSRSRTTKFSFCIYGVT